MLSNRIIAALSSLPEDLMHALKESLERSNMADIQQEIEQIRNKDQALAEELSRLADEFRYDEILSAIQRSRENPDDSGP